MTTSSPDFFEPGVGGGAECRLCFRRCRIARGSSGACGARGVDAGGRFISPYLGLFASAAVDPIEKKPLRRWRPGSYILSLGGVHCNMNCPFCQNHSIAHPSKTPALTRLTPASIADAAERDGLSAVAFTYNEPTLQAEFILDCAPIFEERGIATVLVTNGCFSPDARDRFARHVAAMNIDVKTFSRERYRDLGGSLDAVRENVEAVVSAGVHVELTCLVVPGISDSHEEFRELVAWAADISPEIPLHISRYFPARVYSAPPTGATLMREFEGIAGERLRHVYLGNI